MASAVRMMSAYREGPIDNRSPIDGAFGILEAEADTVPGRNGRRCGIAQRPAEPYHVTIDYSVFKEPGLARFNSGSLHPLLSHPSGRLVSSVTERR
jgi:hypothetical protein